jgi:hypothetical protein
MSREEAKSFFSHGLKALKIVSFLDFLRLNVAEDVSYEEKSKGVVLFENI